MGIETLLVILIGFYLIGIPIWLIVLSGKVHRLQEAQGEQPVRQQTPSRPIQKENKAPPASVPPKTQPAMAQAAAHTQVRKHTRSFEEHLGGNWFQWLGIAALILALVFFLKWAFDNGYIGPVGRTAIGYILAAAAMVAGDRWRKKYGVWSLTFTGGGGLAAYIVTWYAQNYFQLFPPLTAFAIYILVTAVVVLLAAHYQAKGLAAFGIIGAFLTPILTGEGGSLTGLLTYIVVLDLGVLALAHARQWRILNALAFTGTVLWELYALTDVGMVNTTAIGFLVVFSAIYLLVPSIYNLLWKKSSTQADLLILVGSALVHFWLLLNWLDPSVRLTWDAPLALLMSAIYLVFSIGVFERNRKDTPLVIGSLSLTVLFAALAVPFHFDGAWTSVAWSVEAAFLLWASLYLKDTRVQLFAWPVMAAAYIWYLFGVSGSPVVYQSIGIWITVGWALLFAAVAFGALQSDEKQSRPLLAFAFVGAGVLTLALFMNLGIDIASRVSAWERFIHAAALIGGSYAVLWQAFQQWNALPENQRKGFTALGIAAQLVTIAYLTLEFRTAVQKGFFLEGMGDWRQVVSVGTSILWAAYATVALVIGFTKGWRPLRLFSILLLLVAVLKLTLIDLFNLGTGARVIGFTVLGIILVGSSVLYQRYQDQMKDFFVSK